MTMAIRMLARGGTNGDPPALLAMDGDGFRRDVGGHRKRVYSHARRGRHRCASLARFAAPAMTDHRHAPPIPARITVTLDYIGAEGPWVDEALGGAEPMVDQWEAGELVPTPGQVEKLAQLTGFPV